MRIALASALVLALGGVAGCSGEPEPQAWVTVANWHAAESQCAGLGGMHAAQQFDRREIRGVGRASYSVSVGSTVVAQCANGSTVKLSTTLPKEQK